VRTQAELLALPPVLPPGADPLLSRMARFSTGREHLERRAAVLAVLPEPAPVATAVATRVTALLPATGWWDAMEAAREVPAAALHDALDDVEEVPAQSILFQTRDATAALIGGALITGLDTGAAVAQALRDLPVVSTLRRDGADTIVVDLERTPFGAGPHACPGQELALALAESFVDAVRNAGWTVVADQRIEWDPRPNLRLPVQLLLERH
jgi:hypothetical protein